MKRAEGGEGYGAMFSELATIAGGMVDDIFWLKCIVVFISLAGCMTQCSVTAQRSRLAAIEARVDALEGEDPGQADIPDESVEPPLPPRGEAE